MAESKKVDKSLERKKITDDDLEQAEIIAQVDKELERARIVERANKDLEDYIANLKPKEYDEGWPEDRWEEEMEKHPLFMTKEIEEGKELPPLVEAMQQLKYSTDVNTPEELAETYKEEGNEHFKRGKYRWAVHSYTAGIEAGSEDKTVNAILYSNRSFAQFKIGNYKKGLKDAREAEILDPSYQKLYYRGANCAFRLDDFKDCMDWCEKGLQLDPENKSLLELKIKAKKLLDDSRTQRDAATQKEKKERQARHDLQLFVGSRGVTLADNIIDIHEVMPNFPYDDKVHIEENQLVWPVFFNYPEHETSDFIQKFMDESCFQDHLNVMFESGFAEWDTKKQYRSDNLQMYFKDGESLVKVQNTSSLRKVLADPRYKVERGVPAFFVTVKNSDFDKHFRKQHICS